MVLWQSRWLKQLKLKNKKYLKGAIKLWIWYCEYCLFKTIHFFDDFFINRQ